MSEITARGSRDVREHASEIVAAYVAHNSLPASELPGLIASVYAALIRLTGNRAPATPEDTPLHERPTPGQIRNSILDHGLISFLDGKTYKTLKRHLRTYGLDPREYRERYGLPADYPMVAPDYAARRSALAKAIGLGRPGAQAERGPQRNGGSRRRVA
ncbi:MucR family transcriptional regulator [Methylobacterium komagatae]